MPAPSKRRRGPAANRTPNVTTGNSRSNTTRLAASQGAAIDWSASFFSVPDGRTYLGHVLIGRREFRAFDADEQPLGTFATKEEARAVVLATYEAGRRP